MTPTSLVALRYHLLFAGAVLLGYVAVTLFGLDGNPLLGVLAGQGVGAGIQETTGGSAGDANEKS
jgi:hypothetical protein